MSQQPDKFFREKLQGFQKPAPPEVWQRVSQNIGTKTTNRVWLRAAAAVLLIATATVLVVQLNHSERPVVAKNEQVTPPEKGETNPKEETSEKDSTTQERPANTKGETATEKYVAENRKANDPAPRVDNEFNRNLQQKTTALNQVTKLPDVKAVIDTSDADSQELIREVEPVLAESNEISDTPATQERTTIVFTAEEVNEKYLAKNHREKTLDAEATPDEKEASGLKKLLDKAYDLTQNQDPLGTIRQKKNEILAMNFRNDKQRAQND